MAYVGGSLVDLFKAQTTGPPTTRALRRTAEIAGVELTRRATGHTPVVTGELASKWRPLAVTPTEDGDGFTSGTENPDWRAHMVEYGTEPHTIRPKRGDQGAGALDTPEGPRGGAEHPGSHGAFMLARAMEEIYSEIGNLAQPALSAWARDIEERAKRHKGIE